MVKGIIVIFLGLLGIILTFTLGKYKSRIIKYSLTLLFIGSFSNGLVTTLNNGYMPLSSSQVQKHFKETIYFYQANEDGVLVEFNEYNRNANFYKRYRYIDQKTVLPILADWIFVSHLPGYLSGGIASLGDILIGIGAILLIVGSIALVICEYITRPHAHA